MRIKIMIIIFHIFCENSGSTPGQFVRRVNNNFTRCHLVILNVAGNIHNDYPTINCRVIIVNVIVNVPRNIQNY